jgi:hypothetical protein
VSYNYAVSNFMNNRSANSLIVNVCEDRQEMRYFNGRSSWLETFLKIHSCSVGKAGKRAGRWIDIVWKEECAGGKLGGSNKSEKEGMWMKRN